VINAFVATAAMSSEWMKALVPLPVDARKRSPAFSLM